MEWRDPSRWWSLNSIKFAHTLDRCRCSNDSLVLWNVSYQYNQVNKRLATTNFTYIIWSFYFSFKLTNLLFKNLYETPTVYVENKTVIKIKYSQKSSLNSRKVEYLNKHWLLRERAFETFLIRLCKLKRT